MTVLLLRLIAHAVFRILIFLGAIAIAVVATFIHGFGEINNQRRHKW